MPGFIERSNRAGGLNSIFHAPAAVKNMKRLIPSSLIVLIAGFLTMPSQPLPACTNETTAPEFTHSSREEWINSEPLQLTELQGKVVLLDFWTFGCWNCYRSFPWLTAMEVRLASRGLQVIGVHTPEYDHEKIRKNIIARAEKFGLRHPIMIDNDYSYWRAMQNRYWPAFYVIDKKGCIQAAFSGETHEGDDQARRIEKMIEDLLAGPS